MSPALLLLAATLLGESGGAAAAPKANPRVALETTKGKIVLELFADKAPKTVENFLAYVKSGHYDGTIFHRVIPGFMIQGGGFDASMNQKPTGDPIANEAGNGVANNRGTVAMARTNDPGSAKAQFFINSVDNSFLNHKDNTPAGYGYAVFGKVVEGMDVVDAIGKVKTTQKGPYSDVPAEAVVLQRASVVP
jgi:peptidyl-prolyl cis-trans isomerase B (cyclophilin B)